MDLLNIVSLLGAGLAAGFLAGLMGVGGGILFVPVLLFFYSSIGITPEIATPLTLGSSFFCVLIASSTSGWYQYRERTVALRTAVGVGLFSFLSVYLMTELVTTQPWYSRGVFQLVFSSLLLFVVGSMVWRDVFPLAPRDLAEKLAADPDREAYRGSWSLLAGIGLLVGVVAAAAGVGGGIVMIPAYTYLLKMPIRTAVGTSSATIVLISIAGVASYLWSGLGEPVPSTAVGYVDFGHAIFLAVPSILTARLGVHAANRMNTRLLRLLFAGFATMVAIRLIMGAL